MPHRKHSETPNMAGNVGKVLVQHTQSIPLHNMGAVCRFPSARPRSLPPLHLPDRWDGKDEPKAPDLSVGYHGKTNLAGSSFAVFEPPMKLPNWQGSHGLWAKPLPGPGFFSPCPKASFGTLLSVRVEKTPGAFVHLAIPCLPVFHGNEWRRMGNCNHTLFSVHQRQF